MPGPDSSERGFADIRPGMKWFRAGLRSRPFLGVQKLSEVHDRFDLDGAGAG